MWIGTKSRKEDAVMLRVLVVDDELAIREMIGDLIEWGAFGYEITHFAKNGKEALKLYKEYRHELIITDIIMPTMDGLELIRKVKSIERGQKIIILSCHENFYYAREAIKFGVEDYILKDVLTAADFYALLPEIKMQLEKEPRQKVSSLDFRDGKQYYAYTLKEILFGGLKEQEVMESEQRLLSLSGPFVLFGVHIDGYSIYEDEDSRYYEPMIKLRDILQEDIEFMGEGVVIYRDRGEFVLLFELDNITSTLKFMADCNSLASQIKSICMGQRYSVTVGISNGFTKIRDISRHYKEAEQAIKCRMFMGKGKTIFYSTRMVRSGIIEAEQFETQCLSIEKYLKQKDSERLHRAILNLYQRDLKGFMQVSQIKYMNAVLIELAIKYFERWSIAYENVFEENYVPIEQLEKLETIDEMSYWFSGIFLELIRLSQKTGNQYSAKVNKSIEYIGKHYMDNIGLEEIAHELGIHRVYLSNIFKTEIGKSFSKYLLQYRIQKAIELMTATELKNYEIAERTGFANSQQFSSSFKKVTGITPTEFKQKSLV